MRPLYHPPVSEITVQGILHALSDPVRVTIFAALVSKEGRHCAAFLNVSGVPLPKSSLSQQFKVLRESGLIRSERSGVQLINYTRCDEIRHKFGALLASILQAYGKDGIEAALRVRPGHRGG